MAANTEESPESQSETPAYLRHVLERQAALKQTLAECYPKPTSLTLEFGCGHGHFLTAYAQAHPEETCLGIDLVTKRIAKANAKAEKRELTHLRFIKAEAKECLAALPEQVELKKVFMLFPDPWPKKRHHKNRMVQSGFLKHLAERASGDARFYFRTDHEAYFAWTLEILQEHPDWQIVEEPWPFEERSFFQDLMDSWQSLVAKPQG